MATRPVTDLPRHRNIYRMIAAPTIWAVHFLVAYATAAIWCAKIGGDTATLTWIVTGYTLVALALIAWFGTAMWRQWDYLDDRDYIHGGDTDEDRREFMGQAGFLLACLSFVGGDLHHPAGLADRELRVSRAALLLGARRPRGALDPAAGPGGWAVPGAHAAAHGAGGGGRRRCCWPGFPRWRRWAGCRWRWPPRSSSWWSGAGTLPALHEAAYFAPVVFAAEQGSFLLVGLVVWASARTAPPLAGAGGMLLTSMHMTLLGALLVLAPRALYAYCGTRPAAAGRHADAGHRHADLSRRGPVADRPRPDRGDRGMSLSRPVTLCRNTPGESRPRRDGGSAPAPVAGGRA